jgi:hypothetical protein
LFKANFVVVRVAATRRGDPDGSNGSGSAYFSLAVSDAAPTLDAEQSAAGAPGANPQASGQSRDQKEDRASVSVRRKNSVET